jgi:hypothetical protein
VDGEQSYRAEHGPGKDASSNQDMPEHEMYASRHLVVFLACVHARRSTLLECHTEMAI